ncbi:MAG: hypothetical protein AB1758_26675 [Candidatus Eremiobacterota bacterium]
MRHRNLAFGVQLDEPPPEPVRSRTHRRLYADLQGSGMPEEELRDKMSHAVEVARMTPRTGGGALKETSRQVVMGGVVVKKKARR